MNTKNYLIGTLIVACLLTMFGWWNSERENNREMSLMTLKQSSLQKQVLDTRDSAGRQITAYQVQAVTHNQLLHMDSADKAQLTYQLKLANLKLKNLHSTVTAKQVTHDTTSIALHDTLRFGDTSLQTVAFSDSTTDTFLRVSGTAFFQPVHNGLLFQKLNLDYQLKTGLTVSWVDRTKFLHKPKLELELTEQNPHSTTYGVTSYYLEPTKHWYQRFWVHAAIGSVATLVVIHYLR